MLNTSITQFQLTNRQLNLVNKQLNIMKQLTNVIYQTLHREFGILKVHKNSIEVKRKLLFLDNDDVLICWHIYYYGILCMRATIGEGIISVGIFRMHGVMNMN